jgi:hypothetical protein
MSCSCWRLPVPRICWCFCLRMVLHWYVLCAGTFIWHHHSWILGCCWYWCGAGWWCIYSLFLFLSGEWFCDGTERYYRRTVASVVSPVTVEVHCHITMRYVEAHTIPRKCTYSIVMFCRNYSDRESDFPLICVPAPYLMPFFRILQDTYLYWKVRHSLRYLRLNVNIYKDRWTESYRSCGYSLWQFAASVPTLLSLLCVSNVLNM